MVRSPLDPREGYLDCQIEQIYNHGLDENCRAHVQDLPYDYRTVVKDYFGFNHQHGPPNTEGFDEHGHFGRFETGCPGKVIHYVSGEFDMIYDEESDDEEEQSLEEEHREEQESLDEEHREEQESLDEEHREEQESLGEEHREEQESLDEEHREE